MLILSRRQGESIVVGHDVVITVMEVRGNQVRIGVEAPHTLQVHRGEVYEQVVEANREAVKGLDRSSEVLKARRPTR